MHHPDIALIGKARSGKDTIANFLVENHGYTRIAFADPLKEMALKLNPWVDIDDGSSILRLSELVGEWGWDRAKEEVPEVRRILQHMGQGVRELTPTYWVEVLMRKVAATDGPVVVSDCRYLNEALHLGSAGFKLVGVARPLLAETVTPEELAARQHPSETELDGIGPDVTLWNDRDVPSLLEKVHHLLAA